MSDNVDELLGKWEQTYKKGLLSFWMLMVIAETPIYAYEMKEKVKQISQGSISADENSIYRALRRFSQSGLVESEMKVSDIGPNRRYFQLSAKGKKLLASFIERNISVFNEKNVKLAINKISRNE